MAMNLRLTDEQTEALRRQAEAERRSMQAVIVTALDEYVERHARRALIVEASKRNAARYAEALDRLGKI